ncbi:hypothetical protein HAZT_HAZT009763 [Hyalella azteca]|uniref:Serine-threonine/tyrosine-protein kinase catalytic domain-containing protein n=1 Tax=Hyalella azteca TaxID=294128 RepID=A0A6A0GSJ1_HYAAZ|nr:hypothetical protein HAZT_HAZT009763 [Hyalella azteca]
MSVRCLLQWSWGVLTWELSSLAQQPYAGLSCTQITDYLSSGYRLAQPPTCPDVLYQLMVFCWALNPSHRPRAALLVDYLTGLTQDTLPVALPHDVSCRPDAALATALHESPRVQRWQNQADFRGGCASLSSSSSSMEADMKDQPDISPNKEQQPDASVIKDLSAVAVFNDQHDSVPSNTHKTEGPNITPCSTAREFDVKDVSGTAVTEAAQSLPGITSSKVTPVGNSHFQCSEYSTPASLMADLHWKPSYTFEMNCKEFNDGKMSASAGVVEQRTRQQGGSRQGKGRDLPTSPSPIHPSDPSLRSTLLSPASTNKLK